MNALIAVLLLSTMLLVSVYKFDFGKKGSKNDWYVVNDSVMGGRSQSAVTFNDESMIFKGKVSLENNGGFASLRSPYQKLNLQDYTGIRMRVKSESGRKFQFLLEKKVPWYMPTYAHDFQIKKDEWAILEMPIKDFYERRIGEPTGRY